MVKLKVILECISKDHPDDYIGDIAKAVDVWEYIEDSQNRLVHYWVSEVLFAYGTP